MEIYGVRKLLEESEFIQECDKEAEFYFRLVLDDIAKYADPRYDQTSLTNHFHLALGFVCSAEADRAFRKGFRAALDILATQDFNELSAKAIYKESTRKIEYKDSVRA